jgi:hypothetical protein
VTTGATALLTIHLFATAGMVGLIWFVQVVHYPLFARVGTTGFSAYADDHQRRTAWVVGPFMAVEGVTALLVAATLRDEVGLALPLIGLVLLAVIHGSTVFLQVPAHGRLSSGSDAEVIRRLVATNWIRTAGWSARGAVAVAMILVAVPM